MPNEHDIIDNHCASIRALVLLLVERGVFTSEEFVTEALRQTARVDQQNAANQRSEPPD